MPDHHALRAWIEDAFGAQVWKTMGRKRALLAWQRAQSMAGALKTGGLSQRSQQTEQQRKQPPPAPAKPSGAQQPSQRATATQTAKTAQAAQTQQQRAAAPEPARPPAAQNAATARADGWQTVRRGRKNPQPASDPAAPVAQQRPAGPATARPERIAPPPASLHKDWPAEWHPRAGDWGGPLLTAEQAQAGCAGLRFCSAQEARDLHSALADKAAAATAVLLRSPCSDLGTPARQAAVFTTPQGPERSPAWQYLVGPAATLVPVAPPQPPTASHKLCPPPRIVVEAILERTGADPSVWKLAQNATAGRQLLPALQKAGLPACDTWSVSRVPSADGKDHAVRCLARLDAAAVTAAVKASGNAGLFVKPLDEAASGMPPTTPVWTPRSSPTELLQPAATWPGVWGVIRNSRGYGLRVELEREGDVRRQLWPDGTPEQQQQRPRLVYRVGPWPVRDWTEADVLRRLQDEGWPVRARRERVRRGARWLDVACWNPPPRVDFWLLGGDMAVAKVLPSPGSPASEAPGTKAPTPQPQQPVYTPPPAPTTRPAHARPAPKPHLGPWRGDTADADMGTKESRSPVAQHEACQGAPTAAAKAPAAAAAATTAAAAAAAAAAASTPTSAATPARAVPPAPPAPASVPAPAPAPAPTPAPAPAPAPAPPRAGGPSSAPSQPWPQVPVAQDSTARPDAAAGVAPSPASHEHVALEQVLQMLRRLDDRLQRLEDQARDQAAAGGRLRAEVEGLSAGLDEQKQWVDKLRGKFPEAGLQSAPRPEAAEAAAPAAPAAPAAAPTAAPAAPPPGARAAPTPAAPAVPHDPTPAESALALPSGALKRQPLRRSHSTEPATKSAATVDARGAKAKGPQTRPPQVRPPSGSPARPPRRSRTPPEHRSAHTGLAK
jgi:hypothetical protein